MKRIISIFLMGLTFLISCYAMAEEQKMSEKKALVVYFSKTGEQYGVGHINEGNTAIIAKMIAEHTGADLFEIKLKNDTYPSAYKALTEVALAEKKTNARPEIEGEVKNFADYNVVFIGSPNWWADMPMVLYSFIEKYNWNDKIIIPFVTHEGSGLSSIPNKIKSAAHPQKVLEGFAIYGHTAQNSREQADKEVLAWLKKLGY
ncbi:MAG: NAD(P)H-dependent oxidoreductase [Alphaproteobacteria bacterium]|nr:NAD(P)H-dependent oxidoreductase [Alphaproteobacteria bacterium]